MSDLQCPARIVVGGPWSDAVVWPDSLRIAAVYADPQLTDVAEIVAARLGTPPVRTLPETSTVDDAVDAVVDLFRGEAVLVVLASVEPAHGPAPTQARVLHVDGDGRREELVSLPTRPR